MILYAIVSKSCDENARSRNLRDWDRRCRSWICLLMAEARENFEYRAGAICFGKRSQSCNKRWSCSWCHKFLHFLNRGCSEWVTRLGGVSVQESFLSSQASKILQTTRIHVAKSSKGLRATNLKTSFAWMTLLLLSSVCANLSSRGLASWRLSFAAGHCWCEYSKVEIWIRKIYLCRADE